MGYNDWNDTEAMVMQHLTAVEAQLVDMWYGLALAALLRRTIILPKVGRVVRKDGGTWGMWPQGRGATARRRRCGSGGWAGDGVGALSEPVRPPVRLTYAM